MSPEGFRTVLGLAAIMLVLILGGVALAVTPNLPADLPAPVCSLPTPASATTGAAPTPSPEPAR